jgi:hypothetical protein
MPYMGETRNKYIKKIAEEALFMNVYLGGGTTTAWKSVSPKTIELESKAAHGLNDKEIVYVETAVTGMTGSKVEKGQFFYVKKAATEGTKIIELFQVFALTSPEEWTVESSGTGFKLETVAEYNGTGHKRESTGFTGATTSAKGFVEEATARTIPCEAGKKVVAIGYFEVVTALTGNAVLIEKVAEETVGGSGKFSVNSTRLDLELG